MSEFDEYVEKTKSLVPFSTGFKSLDDILDGGIKEGLTTIIAIPGIGKKTFTLQIFLPDRYSLRARPIVSTSGNSGMISSVLPFCS